MGYNFLIKITHKIYSVHTYHTVWLTFHPTVYFTTAYTKTA